MSALKQTGTVELNPSSAARENGAVSASSASVSVGVEATSSVANASNDLRSPANDVRAQRPHLLRRRIDRSLRRAARAI